MTPLYIFAAMLFPAVFILWRPKTPVPPRSMRVRVAGSVVVVWLLCILMSMRSSGVSEVAEEAPAIAVATQPSDKRVGTLGDATEEWQTNSPKEPTLALTFGWMPGLVWTGLLWLARRAFEGDSNRQTPDDYMQA